MSYDLLSTFAAAQANAVASLGLPQGMHAAPLQSGMPPATAVGMMPGMASAQHAAVAGGPTGRGMGAAAAAVAKPTSRTAQAAQRTKTERSTPSPVTVKAEPTAAPSAAAPALAANPYAPVKSEPGLAPGSTAAPPASISLHAAAGADNAYAAAVLGRSAVAPPPHAAAAAASAAARPVAPAVTFHAVSAAAAPSAPRRVGGESLAIGPVSHTVAAPGAFAARPAAPVSNGHPTGAAPVARPAAPAALAPTVTVTAPTTAFNPLVCPECPPGAEVVVDPHQGVEVCTSCGLVIGQVISEESEWRTFSDRRGEDPNRVGGPEIGLLADAGLATLMGDSPDGMGSSLAKLQNSSAMSKNHRQLLDAFRKSSRIASLLDLPRSLTDRSDALYKAVLESRAVRHRGADALMAACIFMVCKAEGVPRTLKEMTAVCDVAPKDLARCFKEMKREGFHKTLVGTRAHAHAHGGPIDKDEDHADELASYVARWGNRLRLPLFLIEVAKEVATRTQAVLTKSADPSSFAGAALYVAGQLSGALHDRRSYEQIEAECHIAPSTLRSVVVDILRPEHAARIVPASYQHMVTKVTP